MLEQALPIDPSSPVTLTNLAIVAIDRGDCDGAQKQLVKLATISGRDEVARTRLLAKTYMCIPRPDTRKAAEAYANAEREAKKANAAIALAQVYTEWAPLTWDQDIDGAVDKLEIAVSATSTVPEFKYKAASEPTTWRSRCIATDGSRCARARPPCMDFERALRDPSVLKGTEPARARVLVRAVTTRFGSQPGSREAVQADRGG